MTAPATLFPRQPVPSLEVPLVGGGTWKLADQSPEHFTLIVFFRGLHCPICSNYLRDLDRKLADFNATGVEVIAISSDGKERAEQTPTEWKVENVSFGYNLDLDKAREWGLYISTGRGMTGAGIEEPDLFSEAALYMVRSNGDLFFGSVQTMPFARPSFTDVLNAVKFVLDKDYPGRGEVLDHHNP